MGTWGIRKKLSITLRKRDVGRIHALLSGGVQPVRVVKRAQALRLLAAVQPSPQVGSSVGLTPKTVRNIGWRYAQAGLWRARRPPAASHSVVVRRWPRHPPFCGCIPA